MKRAPVGVSLDPRMIAAVDADAHRMMQTRSQWIQDACARKLGLADYAGVSKVS